VIKIPGRPIGACYRIDMSQRIRRLKLFSVSGLFISFACGQFVQQPNPLIGTGAFGNSDQGLSLAISADGNTAIVGGPADNGGGSVWIFVRSNGEWVQQGNKLQGTGEVAAGGAGVNFGVSVAISADGNTTVVGSTADNMTTGAAWIFTRSSNRSWSQQGAKLVGSGAAGFARQGTSLATSGDGNTVAIGGSYDNNGAGAVWVFARANGTWKQQGGKLLPADSVGPPAEGASLALSADGNTLITGGPGDNNSVGALWQYQRSGNTWSQSGSKIVPTDAKLQSAVGQSFALSADGSTMVAGGYLGPLGAGTEWVFTSANGGWTQQGSGLVGLDSAPWPAGSIQGRGVAISADGNTMVTIGSSVWIFSRANGVWTQRVGMLSLTGGGPVEPGAPLVFPAIALSGDASTLFAGGYTLASGQASFVTWVYTVPPGPAPSIGTGQIVNAASLLPGIAPASWTTIQGSNLSATTRIWTTADFSGGTLPTELDGVSVTVNGKAAYVYYISPSQINVLTPDDTVTGPVPVQVNTSQGASNIVTAAESGLSSALFTYSVQGRNYAVAVRPDGTLLGPSTPSKPGDYIVLFGTGFGPTTPLSPAASLNPPAPLGGQTNVVMVGGYQCPVQSATLISPGLYQLNVLLMPNYAPTPTKAQDLSVTVQIGGFMPVPVAGATTQSKVYLTVLQ
jgi:uncharacterized protein (TIGR03437 family)